MKKLILTLSIAIASYFSYAQNTFPMPNGNVGIGTIIPQNPLHVLAGSSGQVGLFGYNGTFGGTDEASLGLRFYKGSSESDVAQVQLRAYGTTNYTGNFGVNILNGGTYPNLTREVFTIQGTTGNVGIGTTNPNENLSVAGGSSSGNISLAPGPPLSLYAGYKFVLTTQAADEGFNMTMGGTKIMSAYGYNDADEVGFGNLGHQNLLYLNSSGNVGIGTTSPDTKLTVNGTIHSTEVKVTTSVPTPDYVFEPDYKLPSLNDIKAYVDENHHLPNIPSAKEIEKNGIHVGDMSMKLLKTIEELTLHVIELNSQVKLQNEKIISLENQIKK